MSDSNPYGNTPPEPTGANPPPNYAQQPAYGQGQTPGYPQAPAYPPAPPYGQGYGAQSKTNVMAIISLVGGIAGFVWILPLIGSLAGIIFGHIGLSQIKKTGEQGRALALTGLILGYVGIGLLIIGLIVIFAVIVPIAIENSRYT